MAFINCSNCGKQISKRAKKCPHCGYASNLNTDEEFNQKGPKKNVFPVFVIISVFVIFLIANCGGPSDDLSEDAENEIESSVSNETVQPNNENIAPSSSKNKPTPKKEKMKKKNIDKLPEAKYKKNCKSIKYNKLFFGKKDLTGTYVKLNLFVEEYKVYDIFEAPRGYHDAYVCGVKRTKNGTTSYVGGSMLLLDGSKAKKNIGTGDRLTVWGKITDYSTNSWDGYNRLYVEAKYIKSNG